MSTDLYAVLGVARDADEKTLKSAYRKAAMQYHPDRNPGDKDAERKFAEANKAYQILSDPQKRATYDRFGLEGVEAGVGSGGGRGGGQWARGAGGGAGFSAFADIFEDLFGEMGGGGGQRRRGPTRGSDLRYDLEITLEDAFSGTEEDIEFTARRTCESCDGSGAKPGSQPSQCPTCSGAGRVRTTQGFFTLERTCPRCSGAGEVVSDPCGTCAGSGQVDQKQRLAVQIPPGVNDGSRIRLSGKGEAGPRGGPAGDLYIFVSIKPHEVFERDGRDLYAPAFVSIAQAALGCEIEVPSIEGGSHALSVPEGTQTGERLRLKGEGMPSVRSAGRGDLHVDIFVETPVRLTKKQRELLKEFQKAEPSGGNSPRKGGPFAKAKQFWEGMRSRG